MKMSRTSVRRNLQSSGRRLNSIRNSVNQRHPLSQSIGHIRWACFRRIMLLRFPIAEYATIRRIYSSLSRSCRRSPPRFQSKQTMSAKRVSVCRMMFSCISKLLPISLNMMSYLPSATIPIFNPSFAVTALMPDTF